MKVKIIFTFLLGFTSLVLAQPDKKINIENYLWKNRPILVCAPSNTDSSFQAAQKQLEMYKEDIVERHIVIIDLFEENKGESKSWKNSVQALRKKYNVEKGKLTLILIGKDGGEKMRQIGSIDLQSIFKRIDSMPMRQNEMRQQKKQ